MRATLFYVGLVFFSACGRSPSADPEIDAAIDALPLDATIHVDDGTPMRKPCTGNFGNALTTGYGRLDGYLVAIVQPGNGGCHADRDHVHLQIEMNASIYDVAINIADVPSPVLTTTRERWFAPWQEGWHPSVAFDYVEAGLHKSDFTGSSPAQLAAQLTSELANVNHISIFATAYDPTGVHLVHREGRRRDGVIVTQPLSSPAQARMYMFADQSF
jgi:hypothetical protein